MPDDPTTDPKPDPTPDPKPDPKPDPSPQGDTTDWQVEAKKWEARAKANYSAAARLKEIEDRDKSESQKLTEDRDGHKARADTAEAKLLRLTVGLAKGLTAAQAARLQGGTKEELEKDADELLEAFSDGGKKGAPTTRPTERLRGGNDPTDEPDETDPAKLAAMVPRSPF